jgi:hypothetical protein
MQFKDTYKDAHFRSEFASELVVLITHMKKLKDSVSLSNVPGLTP